MVHRAKPAAERAGQSEAHHESVEGAVVFPGFAGDARLFRSLDRRSGDAFSHHDRSDGLSLCRFKSAGQWLLHATAKTICSEYVRLGIPDVDSADFYRHFHSRTWLDLVLARPDLGPQH